ncbi:MAG TPA: pyruvate formate lyase family protein [Verrucomicrobiae bacterium]|nr:pyruvate formate lyase family protein [Verrucomicrobiae bacterium]
MRKGRAGIACATFPRPGGMTRRTFLALAGVAPAARLFAGKSPAPSVPAISALRADILRSGLSIGLHRAEVFTRIFRDNVDQPWIVRKGLALQEYLKTVPLYLREGDGIAGSISERPGAMPVMVELGIGENNIYTGERPDRKGHLKGQVPEGIRAFWMNENMWGRYRTEICGLPPYKSPDEVPESLAYKFISNQGHLCPSYSRLLRVGLEGLMRDVARRIEGEANPDKVAFLTAAGRCLAGVSTWAARYGEFLASEAARCTDAARASELREMSRIASKVATSPPGTFREALQLVWFVHQAIHIEGQGYSCTPDRLDQLLFPFYEADVSAGRLDDATVVRLAENLVLKMYDNSVWGPEHHLTQGFVMGGSTPDGRDHTNRLSWLFVEGATNLSLPEPLIWIRWHPNIDQKFFDFCLTRLLRSTCFPMMWNDRAIPDALMGLGIAREDAFNYVPVGCNELAIPSQWYYNPGANANYLASIEAAMTSGKGYRGQWKWKGIAPAAGELRSFEAFSGAVAAYVRRSIEQSYGNEMKTLQAQMRWGVTPLTSCFFEGCVEKGRDMTAGTKYNYLSCGGIAFANAVDCLGAVRDVVYERKEATLEELAAACAANFKGHERLRAQLLAAPKHGNDDPRLDDVIRMVEAMRDRPVKEICRDPRDGSHFGNSHVVRSGAVKQGLVTPATPDGRLAGTPLASSMAASVGSEYSGPTAVLNSVCKTDSAKSWQCGYQVNIRFHKGMIADDAQRQKLRTMLNVYFGRGGQELQINVVDTAMLRAAQKDPAAYSDLVVRVAGFSEFFVRLTPEIQEDIIARMEHM